MGSSEEYSRRQRRVGLEDIILEKFLNFKLCLGPHCIAGHRHQCRRRRHRYYGIRNLSPVPECSGTGVVPASVFLFIPLPDGPEATQSGIPAFTKIVWRLKGVHPTQCTTIPLVVDRNTPWTSIYSWTWLFCNVDKCKSNAEMPRQRYSVIGIFYRQ